jgi:hypothetical protein
MSTDYTLAHGAHATPEDGRCAMEWVSYLAGEPHSDRPACVSPVLRAFCVAFNDWLPKTARQRLRPYLTRTIGTVDDGLDEARAWMAMDWLIRVHTPAWLDLADMNEAAWRLVSLPPILDAASLDGALGAMESARRDARAALAAARRASRSPASPVPRIAERSARKTAGASAQAALWALGRVPVGEIAGDRARDAARAAAGDAAAAVSRRARVGPKRAAAKGAAGAALAPTLSAIGASALALLDRMLPTESLAPAPTGDTSMQGAYGFIRDKELTLSVEVVPPERRPLESEDQIISARLEAAGRARATTVVEADLPDHRVRVPSDEE